ncbi:hypothetical protein CC2G_008615 [Coprinopsis cinerea AmutBmut pab1-1]|nr:hypothetical protein CC2G_008615 [Coprinopsis cinerea AmutBmut pab1-1]
MAAAGTSKTGRFYNWVRCPLPPLPQFQAIGDNGDLLQGSSSSSSDDGLMLNAEGQRILSEFKLRPTLEEMEEVLGRVRAAGNYHCQLSTIEEWFKIQRESRRRKANRSIEMVPTILRTPTTTPSPVSSLKRKTEEPHVKRKRGRPPRPRPHDQLEKRDNPYSLLRSTSPTAFRSLSSVNQSPFLDSGQLANLKMLLNATPSPSSEALDSWATFLGVTKSILVQSISHVLETSRAPRKVRLPPSSPATVSDRSKSRSTSDHSSESEDDEEKDSIYNPSEDEEADADRLSPTPLTLRRRASTKQDERCLSIFREGGESGSGSGSGRPTKRSSKTPVGGGSSSRVDESPVEAEGVQAPWEAWANLPFFAEQPESVAPAQAAADPGPPNIPPPGPANVPTENNRPGSSECPNTHATPSTKLHLDADLVPVGWIGVESLTSLQFDNWDSADGDADVIALGSSSLSHLSTRGRSAPSWTMRDAEASSQSPLIVPTSPEKAHDKMIVDSQRTLPMAEGAMSDEEASQVATMLEEVWYSSSPESPPRKSASNEEQEIQPLEPRSPCTSVLSFGAPLAPARVLQEASASELENYPRSLEELDTLWSRFQTRLVDFSRALGG